MLKLSEELFLVNREEKYIDYYQRALYNHTLSFQHPQKGGFVYFTPMRPGHYRVYSQPHTSFWCCVGSGIENHGKYNQFICTYYENDICINLFIPSKLNWKDRGVEIEQQTTFPREESTTLTIKTQKLTNFSLNIRYPSWAKSNFKIYINNKLVSVCQAAGSYVSINQTWKNGDMIRVQLPMEVAAVKMPDDSDCLALKYGPIVLGTKLGDENHTGLFVDDSHGRHIVEGIQISISEMPNFLTDNPLDLIEKVKKNMGQSISFSVADGIYPEKFKELDFIPFYEIHESRYAIYLPMETIKSYQKRQEKLNVQEWRS